MEEQHIYLYSVNKWDQFGAEVFESSEGYHRTAEELANKLDRNKNRISGRQIIYLLDTQQEVPRKFKVTAHPVRGYEAEELSWI